MSQVLTMISPIKMCSSFFWTVIMLALYFRDVTAELKKAAVCLEKEHFKVYMNTTSCPNGKIAAAFAESNNLINSTGWAHLEIVTSSNYTNQEQAYAAGIAEGITTNRLIYYHWMNTVAGYCKGVEEYCKRLQTFLIDNLKYMKKMLRENKNDPYWEQIGLVMVQLAGLTDGYMDTISTPHMELDPLQFLLFQLSGDLEDLEQALNKPKQFRKKVLGSGSCSAFIKLLPGNKDIVFAHDTWSTYQSMLRIVKKYSLKYKILGSGLIPGNTISFSSYPGTLPSIDDFYITSAGLAVTETTIGNNNASRHSFIQPSSVLTWVRSQIACRMATSALKWTKIFSRYNSGTYCNQWMLVDYNKFTPGHKLPAKGVFFVLEQIPGLIISKDMTSYLSKQQYWPSYNIPFYPTIFNESNSWPNVEKYGDWFTYNKSPRALIFKREWSKVKDMTSLTKLMRYNDFKRDPLSVCDCLPPFSGENAIAARCDLNPINGTYPFASLGHRSHGATDMKATNSQMVKSLEFIAISGPTYDPLPPFEWSKSDYSAKTPHYGHPDKWMFNPINVQWKY